MKCFILNLLQVAMIMGVAGACRCNKPFWISAKSKTKAVTSMCSFRIRKQTFQEALHHHSIKHFGPLTINWLTQTWTKARVILKPGKEPTYPKNFKPVSLLCHLFKVLEILVLNRVFDIIEEEIIPEHGRLQTRQILLSPNP